MKPIERDEEMDRTYIPLPNGWEVQTKGKGSTFRLCKSEPDGTYKRWPVISDFCHDALEQMAKDCHAELVATEEANLQQQAEIAQEPVVWADEDDILMAGNDFTYQFPAFNKKPFNREGVFIPLYTIPPSTQALIAAAYQNAADIAKFMESAKLDSKQKISKAILSLTPTYASQALDDLIKQAKMEALKDAAYHQERTQPPYAQKELLRPMSAVEWFFRRPPNNES